MYCHRTTPKGALLFSKTPISSPKWLIHILSFPWHVHEIKYTRPSPAFPYCKQRKAGQGLGTRLHGLIVVLICKTPLPNGFSICEWEWSQFLCNFYLMCSKIAMNIIVLRFGVFKVGFWLVGLWSTVLNSCYNVFANREMIIYGSPG